jgi:hypothetical protein
MVLLSTVVMHHHHLHQICFIQEKCLVDGHVNDPHTSHPEGEEGGCSLQQMHAFIINARTIHHIAKSLIPSVPPVSTLLAETLQLDQQADHSKVCRTEQPMHLVKVDRDGISRRGPPIL